MTGVEELRELLGATDLLNVRRMSFPEHKRADWFLTLQGLPCTRCGREHFRLVTIQWQGGDVRNPRRLRENLARLGWTPNRPVDAELGRLTVRALWKASKEPALTGDPYRHERKEVRA